MLASFLSRLFNLILPPRRSEALVESLSLRDLHALSTPYGLPYQAHEVQALVWELKYYGSGRAASLAGEFLAQELLAIASEELGRPLLIPIPMHYSRVSERGHNHTEVLCEAALYHLQGAYEYAPHVLKRIKRTPEQQKLTRECRLTNVAGSMQAACPELALGRVCVVVDDVTTTGATLTEAKRALRALGALRVHCVALAQS